MNPATVTRQRPSTEVDRYGETVPVWDTPDTAEIANAIWAPIKATESTEAGREGRTIGWTLIVKGTVPDVRATDRIVDWAGSTFNVDGEPAVYVHPVTGTTITEIALTRAAG